MDKVSWRSAQRTQSKASIVIEGLSGTGKSGTALLIASALADWDKIYAADSENKSLDLFEGLTLSDGKRVAPFKKIDLTGDYLPSTYLELRDSAIQDGAEVFIADSLSHAWIGQGGVLDVVGRLEAENSKLNKFNAWGQPVVMDEKNKLPALFRDPRVHCISTVRLKEKFEMIQGEGVHSVGEQQVMQSDMKYEPDLLLRMVRPGTPDGEPPVVKVGKTRYAFLRLGQEYALTDEILKQLGEYLNEGADPAVLKERQRQDYITTITDLLKSDSTKQMSYKMFRKGRKIPDDVKLPDMELDMLQIIYKYISE